MSISTTNQPKIDRPASVETVSYNETEFQPQVSDDPQLVQKDERRIRDTRHSHDGADAPRIDMQNLVGLFQSTNAVPSDIPKTFYDQIKIYSNGGTRRLYIYVTDSAGSGAWRYAALT